MRIMTQGLMAFILLAVLTACGGGEGFSTTNATIDTTTTTTSSSGIQIGNGVGTGFTVGSLSIGLATLSAGGTTSITANLVDSDNNVYTTPVTVNFSSPCTAAQTATMDTAVTTSNGAATSQYVAVGCPGSDTITATAVVENSTLAATVNVTVLPATVGAIEFVSATPTTIALKGTGGTGLSETSTVIFRVRDNSNGLVANQLVRFSLDTTLGGITLSAASGTTASNGLVQVVVNAGTLITPVTVTAAVDGSSPLIETQSVALSISTGIPDNNSFSLAIDTLNPEAWGYVGVTQVVAAAVADHFNNPAPDGTAVSFRTEGGSIGGSCVTVNGQCTVEWVSQSPQPADGRVTIMATVSGEEGFVDSNGNGLFDDGDTFEDLPEAYLDVNESGSPGVGEGIVGYDVGEEFVDDDGGMVHNDADGLYNGSLCAHTSLCAPADSLIHVRDSVVLVMASPNQIIGFAPSSLALPDNRSVVSTVVSVQDVRGQMPPAGTTIAVTTDIGELLGVTSYIVPNTNLAGPYSFGVSLRATQAQTIVGGLLTIKVTSPGNNTNANTGTITVSSASVTLTDVTAPTVLSTTPGVSTGVAISTIVEVEFSEPMAPATINATNFSIYNLTDAAAGPAALVSYDGASDKLQAIFSTGLLAGKTYTATVTTGVTDVAGTPLAQNFSWSFITVP